MRPTGRPVLLGSYAAESLSNAQFERFDLSRWNRIFLPPAVQELMDEPPLETQTFLEDDNRGAILPDPVATLDGTDFFLSVKGVGSTTDPYSWRPLDREYAAQLCRDPSVRDRLRRHPTAVGDRIVTGEVWLRGSPYGGQGLDHATTALRISERANLTSLAGFRIAPTVKVTLFPPELERRIRTIRWYREYRGRIVQEIRLVPSNVRIYFHARNTVGTSVRHVFTLFRIDSNAKAHRFEIAFVRSTVAMLTLFARTLRYDAVRDRYLGFDFDDVWLDKDAVVAPDGTAYFVDLEGIVERALEKDQVAEKIDDQVHRSLYELTFAYEQIETERVRQFGGGESRTGHFETVLREALRGDPYVDVESGRSHLDLLIRNPCQDESLVTRFRAVDP